MEEKKNYILFNIRTLLHLQQDPYQLTQGKAIEKFLSSNQQDHLILACLPSKQFIVVKGQSDFPDQGTIIYISKMRSNANFFNFSVKPCQQLRYLDSFTKNVLEPMVSKHNQSSLFEIKELKAVLQNTLKIRSTDENDLNFNTLQQQFDFWQEMDIQRSSQRCSFFLRQYALIGKHWKDMESIDLVRMISLVETTWAVFNKIWNSPHNYQERRYAYLIQIFATEVKNKIKMSFPKQSDLFQRTFDIKRRLVEAIQCCKKFLSLCQFYQKHSKRKMPKIKVKILQQFLERMTATFRSKSKIDMLFTLHEQNLIAENPQSLLFLLKADNFLSNSLAMLKSNPKAQEKLETEKANLSKFMEKCFIIIQEQYKVAIKKSNMMYLIKFLQRWYYFLSQPQISEKSIDLQNETIRTLSEYIESMSKKEIAKLDPKKHPQFLKGLQMIMGKIKNINILITQFAEHSPSFAAYKKKYETTSQNLSNLQQQHVKAFIKYYQDLFQDKHSCNKVLGKQITKMIIDENGFALEISELNQIFISEFKQIVELKYLYMIPEVIETKYEEARKFSKENSYFKSLQSRYNDIEGKLQVFQRVMLNKQIMEISEKINHPKIKKKLAQHSYQWKDQNQMSAFLQDFNKSFEKLLTYLKLFNDSQRQIQEIAIDLLSLEFNPNNFFVISQKLDQVNKLIDNVSAQRENQEWKKYWKTKLTQVVEVIWKQALLKGILIPMTINTVLIGTDYAYHPQLPQIKEKYYKQLKNYVAWPAQSKHLYGTQLINEAGDLILLVYEQADKLFQKIQNRGTKFDVIQNVMNIDIDSLQDKLSKEQISSEDIAGILVKMKQVKDQIDLIPDQEKIHSINVDNISLKQSLKEVIDNQIQSIVQLIKFSIKIESQQVQDFMSNALVKLQNKPKNMVQMGQAMKEYDKIRESEKQIFEKIKKIEARNMNIRSITGVSFNLTNLIKRWENFQIASVEMNRILSQQKGNLQDQVFKKSEGVQKQVEKLYKRYQQIKPKSQTIDRQQVLQVYDKIKDWKIQWDQVIGKHEEILNDVKHFNMKMPDFNQYNKTKSKLKQQLGNWSLFMEYRTEVEKLQMQQWILMRNNMNKYTDLITKYIQIVKSTQLTDAVLKFFKEMLEENKQAVPLLKSLSGEHFEKEHWGMLFSILKIKDLTSVDKLLFQHLLEAPLLSKANQLRQLQARARGQIGIRDALAQLQAWGLTRQFQLTDYNSLGRMTTLIKQWKDVMTQVSDHQALISSIKDSKYAGRFRSEIQKYQEKFGILDDALLKLNRIQRQWIYLQPIFMRGALPSEQGRWKRLDEQYRNIMTNIANDSRVIQLSSVPGFIETLNTIMSQLQRCQKALNDFLEQKRNKFPRFYFLGDDDMLEILGQSQNPAIIQQHLKKLFSGIYSVKFGQNNEKILAMKSSLGEEVAMSTQIQVTEIVENWLQDLSKIMVQTLKKSLKSYKAQSSDNFEKVSSQVICLHNQLMFKKQCEVHISERKIKQLKTEFNNKLSTLTKSCHEIKNPLTLAKIKSLILDVIHQISILDQLIVKDVKAINEWTWFKQLTFHQQSHMVSIAMANTKFQYTFQYQGNAQKLVYTPLTDKCYLTLTQAMHMGLGGNPYGPAGTGKTQSVKALALAFGRQVLVFNCDEGLDFHSMGRIFMGLVKCGAWGCFDEFNRLLQQQLSAISQQIQIIQEAIKIKEKTINLLGKQLQVNFNSGIFVTLNPAGKGYGGRSKLPDNLKQLFRPVAMSVPDNQLIAQVLLFSQGFKFAKTMAQKIITIFTLSRQLLSRQLHYDWGLRALKTILTVAGRLIFEQKSEMNEKIQSEILIKALRINTISKLTFADLVKFNVLVTDVFPGIDIKDIIYQQIQSAVRKVFAEDKFEILDSQLSKILQFYEATKQRIGAVLVGPSGCGKTTIWKALKKAYDILKQPVKVHLINPKSMPRSSFLGHMNNDTREFSQGVLTVAARQVIKEDNSVLNWIVCDGDVDPQWIEALNSVLDDNHLLTLPTGERISFGSNVNFIFQTDNLSFASPATVSRMGMIFMNEQDINIKSIISKWTKSMSGQQQFLQQKIDVIEEICNKVYQMNQRQVVSTTKVGLVKNAMSLLDNSTNQQQFKLNLVKGLATNFLPQDRGAIFEIVFGKGVPGNRDPLSLKIKEGKITQFKDQPFEGVQKIFMTKEILKDIDIIYHWIKSGNSFIIVGKQGCGKSLLLEAGIKRVEATEKCKVTTIHCNRETKGSQLARKLFQICQKVTSVNGRVLKPQGCHRQIIVLKQINLPKPDKYNTIELITFIQSLITHQGFYDHNLEFVQIGEGIQFVFIMKPSTTLGRFQLTTRFVSNVRVLRVDYESVGIQQMLKQMTPHHQAMSQKLRKFWQIINQNFPSDDNAHYLFCPRNLNSIVKSLQFYDIDMKSIDQISNAILYQVGKQFGDRLVNTSEKNRFWKLIQPLFGKQLNVFYYLSQGKLKRIDQISYVQKLKSYIKTYENDVKEIEIVLFDEVIELMSSIQRKLVQGKAMLIAGSSGSARRASVRIMCNQHKIQLCTLSNIRNPSLKEFYKDLRSILQIAGGQNKKIVLYLEEHQLGKNEFYQKINSLISSGQISGLFSSDQIEGIVQDAQQLRSQFYGKSLYQCFIERIKKNIIIILCLDHRNKSFYEVCSSNPAFYSQCRFVWMNCPEKQSLRKVFDKFLIEYKLPDHQLISKTIVEIHHGSAKKFVHYLHNYINTLKNSQSKSGNKLEKLSMGLKKLNETAKTVDQLTADALSKKKLLTVKQKQADESLNEITQAMAQASESKNEAQKLKSFLQVQQKKIEGDRIIVMRQLDRVQPLIQQAKNAVNGLSKKNIENIRAFLNPPQAVRFVLKAVLTLFGNKDQSWNSMKNFLKTCKEKILYFQIKDVSAHMRVQVQNIINGNAYYFERENVFKASQQAVPLCEWVKAVVQYSKTYEKVRPLQQNLNKIQKQLSRSKIRLQQCTQKVNELQGRVSDLNNNFVKKTNQAQMLKQQLKKAQTALASGQQLLEKLKDQKVRWQKQSNKLKLDVEMLPRYAALTACFITYLSQSPQNVRRNKLQIWKKMMDSHFFNFLNFVTSEASILVQITKGLPNDQLSIENCQILAIQRQVPVIIDPHTQASNWLKNKLIEQGTVETLIQQDPKFINTLQLAIRFGKTLIIQQIDFIQPILTPILKKDYQRQGPRNFIQLGQKTIDVNQSFRLYLTTRNSSIEIPYHQKDLICLINFSVTKSGLQGKLLSIIITHFQPQIEKQKQSLLQQQEKLKINLSNLEQKLLKQLADSSGNILENKSLISSLNQTKEQSQIVGKSLNQSQKLQETLDNKRKVYLPVAQIGAKLYITLGLLKKLSPMYKYNLSQFIDLFQQSLNIGKKNSGDQIQTIKWTLLKIIYDNVSVGLLKFHRLLFAILIIKQTLEGVISENQFAILIGNVVSSENNKLPHWLDESDKQNFNIFISQIKPSIDFNDSKWESWFKRRDCEEHFPSNSLSSFQQSLLISACRSDRLINSLTKFVMEQLHLESLTGIDINMKTLAQEKMSSKIPCLFIVSVGFDPSKQIQQYASKIVGKQRFKELSMGGDQNQLAIELLKQCAKQGNWLCLKNLHLVVSFLSVLQKQLLSMQAHQNFKLFLTTQSHEKFPPILLENCYKVSYQAPPGLKKNFIRLLGSQNISQDKTLQLILTYFHSLIQERRNYIPQGWSKFYQFNYGDYKAGLNIIGEASKAYQIDWSMLYGLMLDTVYGGRIDNIVDMKLMDVYIRSYFNEKMKNGSTSIYKNIKANQIQQIITHLPESDNPELYGLPLGIDQAIMRNKAKDALQNLKIINSGTIEQKKFSRQLWSKSLSPFFTLWKGLMSKMKSQMSILQISGTKLKTVDPIENFVYSQINEATTNLLHIEQNLKKLNGVLSGHQLLTTQLQQIGKAIIRGQPSIKWRKIWEGPDLVVQWVKLFIKKYTTMSKWLDSLEKGSLLKEELDLADVYRPQIFFNALKQKTGREEKIPINELRIKSSFSKPTSSIYIRLKNILLQGCSLSGNSIVDSKNDEQYEQIPTLYIYYSSQLRANSEEQFSLPFYTDFSRTVLLSLLPVAVNGPAQPKIISSSAFLLKQV